MELDLTGVKSRADVKVIVKLTGAPTLKASYLSRDILPDHVSLTYVHQIADGIATWSCRNIDVSGHRVLKPAEDGSIRIGKDRHSANWSSYGSRDLAGPVSNRDREVPVWLVNLVNELRPAGYIELPGA